MKSVSIIILFFTVISYCTAQVQTPDSTLLSLEQINEDVDYLKHSLISYHYDLNWENRKRVILEKLDQIKNDTSIHKIYHFKDKLYSVIKTIDDGHTCIFHKSDNGKSKASFACLQINKEYTYLKIPNFKETNKLKNTLELFRNIDAKNKDHNLIIDFRNNHGGHHQNIKIFLDNFVNNQQEFCHEIRIKLKKRQAVFFNGLRNPLFLKRLKYLLNGYKKKDDYYIKNCSQFKNKATEAYKMYIVVDSTIISGSMLATYHLKKEGAIVLGRNPNSLFNTFGNMIGINLPNSKLDIGIGTARIILNSHHQNRQEDLLKVDVQIDDDLKIEDIINVIS